MARTRAERNRAVVGPLAGVLAVVLAPWAFRCLALWDEGLLPTAADAPFPYKRICKKPLQIRLGHPGPALASIQHVV